MFCKLCGQVETTNHILLNCSIASFLWCVIRGLIGKDKRPETIREALIYGNGKIDRKIWGVMVAGILWVLWGIRNDWVFRNILLKSPIQAIYKLCSLIQCWARFQKGGEETLRKWVEELMRRARELKGDHQPEEI